MIIPDSINNPAGMNRKFTYTISWQTGFTILALKIVDFDECDLSPLTIPDQIGTIPSKFKCAARE